MLAFGSIGFGFACLILLLIATGHKPHDAGEAIAELGVSVGAGVAGILVWLGSRPGPLWMEIGPEGVSLRYQSRAVRIFDARDPGSRMKLYAFPAELTGGGMGVSPTFVIMRAMPFRNPITPEAYTCLIDWARKEHVRIEDHAWLADGPNPSRTVRLVVERQPR